MSGQQRQTTVPALLHLFCEVSGYCLRKATEELDAEARLHSLGMSVGARVLDTLYFRDKPFRRETKILSLLQFIANSAWRQLFGHTAELSVANKGDEYYILDRNLVLNRYMSPPPDASHDQFPNCGGAFAAGLVEGMFKRAEFPKSVYAVYTNEIITDDWVSVTLVIKNPPPPPNPQL